MEITDIKGSSILSNGLSMPYLGLGAYKVENGNEINIIIEEALKVGYRLIDTASFYKNETGVGKAIQKSGISRKDIFVTSKIWIEDQGANSTRKAFKKSLEKLGMDYLDLYLIHWPVPGKYLETWKIMQELYEEGLIKAIGVCNCLLHQLEAIKSLGGVQPMVLQNEFHPKLIQQELLNYCKVNNIQYQAWSPLMRGKILNNSLLQKIGENYQKSAAQIVLRWDLQKDVATIPKSVHKDRIGENADIFDFELTEDEVNAINKLEDNTRTGAHPDSFMDYFS